MDSGSDNSFRQRLKIAIAKVRGTTVDDIPVPYQLPCRCGNTFSGVRRPTWQRDSCSRCGKEFFVLPVNVYPSTRAVPSHVIGGRISRRLWVVALDWFRKPEPGDRSGSSPNKPKASGTQTEKAVAADPIWSEDGPPVWDGNPSQSPSTESESGAGSPAERKRKTRRSRKGQDAQTNAASKEATADQAEAYPILKPPRRRLMTPLRWIGLASLALVLLTVVVAVRQSRISTATAVLRTELDALEAWNGTRAELYNSLQRAAEAVQVLDRRDAVAREILLREQGMRAVLTPAVIDLSEELDRLAGLPPTERMSLIEELNQQSGYGWFLFDTTISPAEGLDGWLEAEWPVPMVSGRIRCILDSARLQALAEEETDRLLFCAPLLIVLPASDGSSDLYVVLDGSQCFPLITELQAQTAGLLAESDSASSDHEERYDADIRDLLNNQRRKLMEELPFTVAVQPQGDQPARPLPGPPPDP